MNDVDAFEGRGVLLALDDRADRPAGEGLESGVAGVEGVGEDGRFPEERPAHGRPLAPLPRKNKDHPAAGFGLAEEHLSMRRLGGEGFEDGRGVGGGLHHQRGAGGEVGSAQGRGVEDVAPWGGGVVVEPVKEVAGLIAQGDRVAAGEQQGQRCGGRGLGGEQAEVVGICRLGGVRWSLLKDDVGVGSADPKRRHPGAAQAALLSEPWGRLLDELKTAAFPLDVGALLCGVEGLWEGVVG